MADSNTGTTYGLALRGRSASPVSVLGYGGLAMTVSVLICVAACGSSEPVGRFGAYAAPFKELRLPGGDTLTVYRVKQWSLEGGRGSLLQLEYQVPTDRPDSASLVALALRIWPVFAPYVDSVQVPAAVLTATDLRGTASRAIWRGELRHFGLVVERHADGAWRFVGDSIPLPPSTTDPEVGIFEPNGARFRLPSGQEP